MARTRSPRRTGEGALLGLAIVFISFASALKAQNVYTWANVGSDWGTAADWGGTVPTGTDIGLFNAGPYTFQPDLGSPYSVGAVWNTGSGSVTVTDNALTLNGCMVNGNSSIGIEMDPGGGALTFSNSLALGGPQTWLNNSGSLLTAGNLDTAAYTLTIAGSSNVALSGNVSDAGGLTMLGSGLLQLSGSNTYSGPTITDGGTLQLAGGQLVGSTLQYVGSANTASFVQSAGTVGAASGLYLGYTGSGNGSYTLSAGSLGAANQYVGYSGVGSFAQSGGLNSTAGTAGTLYIGYNALGNGSYSLSAGTLALSSSASTEYIGYSGSGSFTNSGGLDTSPSSSLYLGYNSTGNGSYTLTTGTLSGFTKQFVGYLGSGSFSQSGGFNISSSTLCLGYGTSGIGSYSMSGGSLSDSINFYVGYSGSGSVALSGGTATASNVYAGFNAGSTGSLNISGSGSLSATNEYIGYSGSGAFAQTGGTNTTGTLFLGENHGSIGTYNLSGNSVLSATNEYVGNATPGTFIQTAGSNTMSLLSIGSSSRYELAGGTLQFLPGTAFTSAGTLDGGNGPGTWNIAGSNITNLTQGKLVNTSSMTVNVGPNALLIVPAGFNVATGFGSYSNAGFLDVTGTSLTVGSGQALFGTGTIQDPVFCQGTILATSGAINMLGGLNVSGTGVVNLGSGMLATDGATSSITGGTVATGLIYAGSSASAAGSLNISGGSLSATTEYIGYSGSGSYSLSAGSNTASTALYVGELAGSIGTAAITQTGYLKTATLGVGESGTGSLTQSGGAATATSLYVGMNATGNGAYNMSGGSLSAATQYVGYTGTGSFTNSGGTVTGNLYVGYTATTGSGTYNLSGGSLYCPTFQYIGYSGTGSFTQSAGTNTIGTNQRIGASTTGKAIYNQSGGMLNATNQYVGYQGNGAYSLTGGTDSVSGTMYVGYTGTGSFNYSGGILNTAGNIYMGYNTGGSATVTQSSGTISIPPANALIMGYGDGSATPAKTPAVYNMTGGLLTTQAPIIGDVTAAGVNVAFNQSGGTVAFPTDITTGIQGIMAVGNYGAATYNLSGSGVVTGNELNIGQSYYSSTLFGTGNFNQSGGLLDTTANATVNGFAGVGNFMQSGGTNASGEFINGYYPAASGEPAAIGNFTLTGGTVSVLDGLEVGYGGTGIFSQSGGSASCAFLELGVGGVWELSNSTYFTATTAAGTATITGGQIVGSTEMNLGVDGSGTVYQSGGLVDFSAASGGAVLGFDPTGVGTYNLGGSGVFNSSALSLGYSGAGVYTQTGGTLSCGFLDIASFAGATGTANISGGQIVGSTEMNVGDGGTGIVNQSGGLNDWSLSTGGVVLGFEAGGFGTYNLSGSGVFNSSALALGYSGAAVFTQTGGTNNCLGGVAFGIFSGSSGTLNLNGGLLNLAGGMGIGSGNGQFNFGGGTLAAISTISVPMPITLTGLGTIATNGNVALFSGQISGPGGLIYSDSGGGCLILAASNTYSGGTQITSGSVDVGSSSALGTGALAANGGTLDLSGYGVTVGSFSGAAGTVTNNGFVLAALTISQTGTASFGGAIQDGAAQTALVLSGGTGTLVLTGTNTYTGGTTVSSGTLVVDNSYGLADGSSLSVGADVSLFGPLNPAAGSRPADGSDLGARVPVFDPLSRLAAGSRSAGDLRTFAASPEPGVLAISLSAPLSSVASSQPAVAAVPEPGTLALLCGAAAMSAIYPVFRRRNRRRRAGASLQEI